MTRRPNKMNRLSYLKRELIEAHKDIESARSSSSWVAVATLRRQSLSLRAEIDEMVSAESSAKIEENRMTDDQIIEELTAAIAALPVSVVEEIMEVCEDKVGKARLKLIK